MNKKVLIIEDEVLIAYHIAELLSDLKIKQIEMAHSYLEAFEKINYSKPDLLILDINLNDRKDGILLAEELNHSIPIIYLTANTDITKLNEAIKQQPVAILTKPIKKIDLLTNVSLFFTLKKQKENIIYFKSNGEKIFIDEKDILYGKIEDNYLFLFTKTQKFVIRTSIETFLNSNEFNFIQQCHRSFLVNPSKIIKLKTNTLCIDEIEIPVSRSFKQALFKRISSLKL